MRRALQGCIAAILAVHSTAVADTFEVIAKFTKDDPSSYQEINPYELTEDDNPITTPAMKYWVVRVTRDSSTKYCIIIGPEPTNDQATGEFIIRGSVKYPGGRELAVIEGVAYYAGAADQYPYGGTQGGSGVGEGTFFMAYGRPGGSSDYIILFENGIAGTSVEVSPAGQPYASGTSFELKPANHYLRLEDNNTSIGAENLHAITKYSTPAPVRDVMFRTVAQVDIALRRAPTLKTSLGLDRPLPF
jgi:hypothetical protein